MKAKGVMRVITTNYRYQTEDIRVTRYADEDATVTIEFTGAGGRITLKGRHSAAELTEILKTMLDEWAIMAPAGVGEKVQ